MSTEHLSNFANLNTATLADYIERTDKRIARIRASIVEAADPANRHHPLQTTSIEMLVNKLAGEDAARGILVELWKAAADFERDVQNGRASIQYPA